jgi:dsDNA-binding SOS-regulon protein
MMNERPKDIGQRTSVGVQVRERTRSRSDAELIHHSSLSIHLFEGHFSALFRALRETPPWFWFILFSRALPVCACSISAPWRKKNLTFGKRSPIRYDPPVRHCGNDEAEVPKVLNPPSGEDFQMAIEIRYHVVRNGKEVGMYTSKKEADEHDKMLDIADTLFAYIEKADHFDLDEHTLEELTIYLSKNREDVIRMLKGLKAKTEPAAAETPKPGKTTPKKGAKPGKETQEAKAA